MTALQTDFIARKAAFKRPKTAAEYLQWNPHDGYKYEWQNGKLLKTHTMIQPEQQFIVDNLLDIFQKTAAFAEGGRLSVEVKSKTVLDAYRVPDLAYFSIEQRRHMANGQAVVPQLVIEIISKTDAVYDTLDKVQEYFDAGIGLVWWVIPPLRMIFSFKSITNLTAYSKNMVCDADTIIKGFSFKADDIFQKP
jgi:Uma2 family endonuclease